MNAWMQFFFIQPPGLQNIMPHMVCAVWTHTVPDSSVFPESVRVACLCVRYRASICPCKQSWQANLIWPGKGQPHSNCLSLTLFINAPSPVSFLPSLPFSFFFSLTFSYNHSFFITFISSLSSPLFHSLASLSLCHPTTHVSLVFSPVLALFAELCPLFPTTHTNTHSYRATLFCLII